MSKAGYMALLTLTVWTPPASSADYTLTARGNVVEITVEFVEPYAGKPLVLFTGTGLRETSCFAREANLTSCPQRFVGAMAVVHFYVRSGGGNRNRPGEIRERVTVTAQSGSLAAREPFFYSARLVDGAASDIQLFGYDEGALPETERESARREWTTLWRVCHQELYLGSQTEAFAVLEWRHSISGIRLIGIHEPPESSSRMDKKTRQHRDRITLTKKGEI